MEKSEKLLEVSMVAQRLTVSPRTIRRMIENPAVPLRGVRLNQKCIRVIESSVDETIKALTISKQATI